MGGGWDNEESVSDYTVLYGIVSAKDKMTKFWLFWDYALK